MIGNIATSCLPRDLIRWQRNNNSRQWRGRDNLRTIGHKRGTRQRRPNFFAFINNRNRGYKWRCINIPNVYATNRLILRVLTRYKVWQVQNYYLGWHRLLVGHGEQIITWRQQKRHTHTVEVQNIVLPWRAWGFRETTWAHQHRFWTSQGMTSLPCQ